MINFLYSLMLFLLSISSMIFSITLLLIKKTIIIEWMIISLINLNFEMMILMDWMSMMFLSIVMFISSMVMMYSKEYMLMEIKKKYFSMILMLFVISMILMIICPNMMSIILGWDGLGLVSYCLIIYYQSSTSFNSGMITLLTNRIGDIMLLMMIFLSMNLKSWNIKFYNFNSLMFLIFLLIMIMTKSAQIPFSMWLPAAMAAPTPVSSLVHSSTLVTAGIYILIRFNYLFMKMNWIILIIGLLTMLTSSINALFEFDLKKIIAFSTLSQLGLMMHMLAYNLPNYVFFHLISHAMFKSLLFLCSGIMIHFMLNYQDIRFMGSLIYECPMVIMFFNFANLSLCGFPFLSGFYSKDMIYEMSLNFYINPMIMILMYISISLTMMYTLRLMFFLTFNSSSFSPMSLKKDNFIMNFSISMLFFMSIIFGNLMNWLMFSSLSISILNFKLKFLIYLMMFFSLSFLFTKKNMWNLNFPSINFILTNFFLLQKNSLMIKMWLNNLSLKMFYFNETLWNEYYSKFLSKIIFKKNNFFLMKIFNNYFISIFILISFNLLIILMS